MWNAFRRPILALTTTVLLMGNAGLAQHASAPPMFTSCVSQKGPHPCDWADFHARFTAARGVWVEEAPVEQTSYAYIAKMLREQGKVVESAPTAKAELLVSVMQAPSMGIAIGPSDQPLGQLVVFSHDPSKEGSNGELVWVETYYGQPDRPWASVVASLVDQFQERLKKNNH